MKLPRESRTARTFLNLSWHGIFFLVNTAITFFLPAFIVRQLSLSGYGLYVLIAQIPMFLTALDFQPSAAIRFELAVRQHEEVPDEKQQLIGACLLVGALMMPILAGLGGFLYLYFDRLLNIPAEHVEAIRHSFLFISVFLLVSPFLSIPAAILKSQNYQYVNLQVLLAWRLARAVGVVGLVAMGFGFGALSAWFLIVEVGRFGVSLVAMRRKLPWVRPARPPRALVKYLAKRTIDTSLIAAGSQFLMNGHPFLLLLFLMPEDLAVFQLCLTVIVALNHPAEAFSSSVASSVSDLFGRKMRKRLRDVINSLLLALVPVTGTLVVMFFLLNKRFITLWTGKTVDLPVGALVLLAVLLGLKLEATVLRTLAASANYLREIAHRFLFGALLFSLGLAVTAGKGGLLGYLLPLNIALLGLVCSLLGLVARVYELNMKGIGLSVIKGAALTLLLCVLGMLYGQQLGTSTVSWLVSGIVGSPVVFGLLWVLTLNAGQRRVVLLEVRSKLASGRLAWRRGQTSIQLEE